MSYFVPPCNYGMVEYDLSRSGQCHQLNFPFLERLNLKTVIYLSYDQPSHALYVSTLCVTCGVLLFFLFFRSVIWVSQTCLNFVFEGKNQTIFHHLIQLSIEFQLFQRIWWWYDMFTGLGFLGFPFFPPHLPHFLLLVGLLKLSYCSWWCGTVWAF
jgi:hypothetical protein